VKKTFQEKYEVYTCCTVNDGTHPKENLTVACVRAHALQSKISAYSIFGVAPLPPVMNFLVKDGIERI
jgi:hypothetical protein